MDKELIHKVELTATCILKPPKERRPEPGRKTGRGENEDKEMAEPPVPSPRWTSRGDYNRDQQIAAERPKPGDMKKPSPEKMRPNSGETE